MRPMPVQSEKVKAPTSLQTCEGTCCSCHRPTALVGCLSQWWRDNWSLRTSKSKNQTKKTHKKNPKHKPQHIRKEKVSPTAVCSEFRKRSVGGHPPHPAHAAGATTASRADATTCPSSCQCRVATVNTHTWLRLYMEKLLNMRWQMQTPVTKYTMQVLVYLLEKGQFSL